MVLAASWRRNRARAGSSRWRGGTWDSHRRGGVAPAPETPGGGVRTTLAASGSLAATQANSGGLWRTPGILRWQKIRPFAELYGPSRTWARPSLRDSRPVSPRGECRFDPD